MGRARNQQTAVGASLRADASRSVREQRVRARAARDRAVLEGGADILLHPAPPWALADSVWTRIAGVRTVYIEARESRAAALYYARYGENPYERDVRGEAITPMRTWEGSFVRASAADRNVHLVCPRGGSEQQVLVDETQAEDEDAPTLSCENLLEDEGAFAVLRRDAVESDSLNISGEKLRSQAADDWERDDTGREYDFDPWASH